MPCTNSPFVFHNFSSESIPADATYVSGVCAVGNGGIRIMQVTAPVWPCPPPEAQSTPKHVPEPTSQQRIVLSSDPDHKDVSMM